MSSASGLENVLTAKPAHTPGISRELRHAAGGDRSRTYDGAGGGSHSRWLPAPGGGRRGRYGDGAVETHGSLEEGVVGRCDGEAEAETEDVRAHCGVTGDS
jgi:hypothetical protein